MILASLDSNDLSSVEELTLAPVVSYFDTIQNHMFFGDIVVHRPATQLTSYKKLY